MTPPCCAWCGSRDPREHQQEVILVPAGDEWFGEVPVRRGAS